MNVSVLAGISFGIAVLVAAVSLFIPAWVVPRRRPPAAPSVVPALVVGALGVLIVFVLTLPASPPFSVGMRLGLGVLIGGVIGLQALWWTPRLAPGEPYVAIYASASAVAALSLTLLLFAGNPGAALLGCALGFGLAAGVGRVMVGGETTAPLELAAVLGGALAAGSVLALARFGSPGQRGWWAYPMALAASWLLGQAIAAGAVSPSDLPTRRPAASTAIVAGAAAAAVLLLGWLLASRLEPPLPVLGLLIVGLVTGFLAAWIAVVTTGEGAQPAAAARGAALAALLVLFLMAVAFRALHGFGAAVALIAAAGLAVSMVARGRSIALSAALALGVNFLLLRLFLERSDTLLGEVETSTHYTLLGMALGALLPILYASLHSRPGAVRAVALGLLTAASPPIVLALWGQDAGVGLLAGLVIAPAVAAVAAPFGPERWAAPAPLMALGMALILVQFSGSLLLLYDLPRAAKMGLAGAVALVAVLWILGASLAAARPPRAAEEE
jgi:hypothetical protein